MGNNFSGCGDSLSCSEGGVVLSLYLLELLDVGIEVVVLDKSDDELGLLLLAVFFSLHGDCLGLDLKEVSVLVSILNKDESWLTLVINIKDASLEREGSKHATKHT